MQKYVFTFIFGILVGICISSVPAFKEESTILSHVFYGLLAAFAFYYISFRKIDFDDLRLYVSCFLYFIASIGIYDVLNSNNANLLIYIAIYLLGSIPFGLLIAKMFANVDIQKVGSNSIGATNVLRTVKQQDEKLAKKLALATLILDFLKAFLPIIIAKLLGCNDSFLWSIGFFAVLGHCFSFYLALDGGKGVATGAGVMAALLPIELLVSFCVWFIVLKISKISSLSSLCAALCFIILSFIIHKDMSINTHAPVILICLIVFYKHIPNIKRLVFKEEKKVL